MFERKLRLLAAMVFVSLIGAGTFAFQEKTKEVEPAKTVVINITTGPDEIMNVVTAFRVAEDAMDDRRHVVLFFNGRGVTVPVKRLHQELRLGNERPVWVMLNDLVRRGAEVLVARESARILGMVDADFIQETQFGAVGGEVFSKMDRESVVFTY